MAEAFVPLLEKLADVALNQLQEHIDLVKGVEENVNELSVNLNAIKKLLGDVEMKKMKEEDLTAVDLWLEEFKELAYEMDDVLDQWITENSKLAKASQNASSARYSREKVQSFFLPVCLCAKDVSLRHGIALKIRDLSGRVDRILKRVQNFEFTRTGNGDSSKTEENNRRLAVSVLNESEVCGRKSEESTVVEKLLVQKYGSTSFDKTPILVVSIVGVGGIGKTTLAKKIFNDDRVKAHFDYTIWVGVSNPFEEKRIAKAILQRLHISYAADQELEELFNLIRGSLENRKFLLVLDDVWTEDEEKWRPLRDTLRDGAPESRILVTTRNQQVAAMLGSSQTNTHLLSPLETDHCWSILSHNAFSEGSQAFGVQDNVKNIGWRIASKCQGLPLAASFMGNLLKFKSTVKEWEEVLCSEIWKLKKPSDSESIFAHLYLSYKDLEPELKSCFSYCALFPKNSRIVVDQLIKLWIAQGFLSSSGTPVELESRGRECFKTLAMRSFFYDFERDADDVNNIITCKIHDIVHDFVTFLTEKDCCVVQKVNDQGMPVCSGKVRHLNLMASEDKVNLPISVCQKLRSIFCSGYIPPNLFASLNSVRVLSLHDCELHAIPKEVGNFIHLRYMDLSDNPLTELPEAISYLYNLETLDIKSCRSLVRLPSRIRNLAKLRCLVNHLTDSLHQFPEGFEELTSLRTLSVFKIGPGYNKLGSLKNLNQLLGSLEIVIILSDDASEADAVYFENGDLKNKENIQNLTLRFSNSSVNVNFIEALQPPPKLENLKLQGYGGTNFPSWMVTSANYLKVLDIRNCNVLSLPALGNLPWLEILTIYGTGLNVLGRDFLGITESSSSVQNVFPRLKKLSFQCLEDWETWEDITEEEANSIKVMPFLEELNLYKCNRLNALPRRLLHNASSENGFTLSLKVCLLLVFRYSKLLGDEWKEIEDIPKLVKHFD